MNTNATGRKCPGCGGEVPGDAPRGLCPRCVMMGAASEAKAGGVPFDLGEVPTVERVAASICSGERRASMNRASTPQAK